MELRFILGLIYIISTLTTTETFRTYNKCTLAKSRKEMHCGNEHFRDVPFDLIKDKDFDYLYMELNKLTVLNTKGFNQLEHKNSLKKIYLYGNEIENIESDFREIPNLIVIDISDNKLKQIGNQFHSAKNLEVLNLEGNLIDTVSEDAFRNLEHLRFLSLKNNKITKLPKNFLRGSKITELDLSGNYIENFDEVYMPPSLVTLIFPEKKDQDSKGIGNSMRADYFIILLMTVLQYYFSVINISK